MLISLRIEFNHDNPTISGLAINVFVASIALNNDSKRNEYEPNLAVPSFRQLLADLWAAIKTVPGREFSRCVAIVLAYSLSALVIGFSSGIYTVQLLDIQKFWFLPLTLFLFPSIPEEFFFRGLLIPRNAIELPWQRSVAYVVFSAFAFTVWHPLNALTINPTAQQFFLDPFFLTIVFLLGLACGFSYLLSRSIWVPVLIHWLTVVVWVLFLGGRNLVLE